MQQPLQRTTQSTKFLRPQEAHHQLRQTHQKAHLSSSPSYPPSCAYKSTNTSSRNKMPFPLLATPRPIAQQSSPPAARSTPKQKNSSHNTSQSNAPPPLARLRLRPRRPDARYRDPHLHQTAEHPVGGLQGDQMRLRLHRRGHDGHERFMVPRLLRGGRRLLGWLCSLGACWREDAGWRGACRPLAQETSCGLGKHR